MPKVTIVVPVYNVEGYLEKCVASIYAQTEEDYELLLVDDGSTDSSGALCDRLAAQDSRARVIHQENAGLGGARNAGIEQAVGEWLLFVDSDDYLEPEILAHALALGEQENAQLVMFAFRSVTEDGREISQIHESLAPRVVLNPKEHQEVYRASPCAWNKLYRASLFTQGEKIRYPGRVWYEDIRTTLKLYPSMERFVYLDEIGYNYVQRAGSIVNNKNADKNVEILEAFEDLLAWFGAREDFERYEETLCYLAVYHIYLVASVRVLRIDPHHPLLEQFSRTLSEQFPHWRKNPLLKNLSPMHKLLLFLLERKWFAVIALLFRIRG